MNELEDLEAQCLVLMDGKNITLATIAYPFLVGGQAPIESSFFRGQVHAAALESLQG